MNNWRTELFLGVLDRLSEISDLSHIDMQRGQFQSPGSSPPVRLPCVLVEFLDCSFYPHTHSVQKGTVNMRLYLIVSVNSDYHKGSETIETGLKVFGLLNEIFLKLQNSSGKLYSKTNRKSEKALEHVDAKSLYVINFEVEITDDYSVEPDIRNTTFKIKN